LRPIFPARVRYPTDIQPIKHSYPTSRRRLRLTAVVQKLASTNGCAGQGASTCYAKTNDRCSNTTLRYATLQRFALPNLAIDSPSEESEPQFTQNPVVPYYCSYHIKTLLKKRSDRKEVSSLFGQHGFLAMYPQDWVTRYSEKCKERFDSGRSWPGFVQSLKRRLEGTDSSCGPGPGEEFLSLWLQ
jgi:hypothetical protein